MSRKRNCYDNAVAESFFKALKVELVYQNKYKTKKKAEKSITYYIENFYGSVASVRIKYKNLSHLKVIPPIYKMI